MVILTFLAFEVLRAPLMILDAKSDLADPTQTESKRTFKLAVQGPLVDLHKNLSRLVHQRVRYRARGTGLIWLDYDRKKSNAIKVRNIARRKLLLQDTNPPFDCATCKGSLHAVDFVYLLGLLTACISVTAMLPVIMKVAVISGNGLGHVFAALACKELSSCTVKCCVLLCKVKYCLVFCLGETSAQFRARADEVRGESLQFKRGELIKFRKRGGQTLLSKHVQRVKKNFSGSRKFFLFPSE